MLGKLPKMLQFTFSQRKFYNYSNLYNKYQSAILFLLSRDSSWGLSRVSIGVPHGVSIRVPHKVSIRVPHGVSIRVPHGVSIRVPHGVVIHPDICPDTEGDHRLAFLQHLQHPAATVCHIEPDTLVLTDLGHLNKYIKKKIITHKNKYM